ncbi:MAG: histidine--tRNA ligase [Armatimonadetes bacterium]|nr:histidine--tRNA ligase [Armatimonadota bacterium]MDW8120969.1 histidine--tRNA ligase [Armatimonadota bacterium]
MREVFRRPRGTQDILPDQVSRWRTVEEKFRHWCGLYGYWEVRTPAFESRALFERTVGDATDIVEKQMFRVGPPKADEGRPEQKEKEEWVLRPEGTAPVARAVLENGLLSRQSLVKLFYVAAIFRYERPQAGRLRQHHQCGVEALGSGDPALDAEVIDLGWNFLNDCHIEGLSVFLNSIGCLQPECRPRYRQDLLNYFWQKESLLCKDCRRRLQSNPLRILDCKEETCQPVARKAPKSWEYLCPACQDHFSRLQDHLSGMGIPFEIDGHLVRGLDYYQRTVFEFRHMGLGAQNTILGGGRYDGLIEELGGPATPGVGFGCGIERVLLAMVPTPNEQEQSAVIDVFVAPLTKAAQKEGVKLLSALRKKKIAADMDYSEPKNPTGTEELRSLKGQMRQAHKRRARLVIIIGDDELTRNFLTVRDMVEHRQWTVAFGDAVAKITAYILGQRDPSLR